MQKFSESAIRLLTFDFRLPPHMTFTWDTTYAIALELRRQHPEANIEEVSLGQIYHWTLQLSEFEDDPSLANDDILYAIYQDWFEENIHGQ